MVEEKTSFRLPPASLWESIAKLSIVEDKTYYVRLLERFT